MVSVVSSAPSTLRQLQSTRYSVPLTSNRRMHSPRCRARVVWGGTCMRSATVSRPLKVLLAARTQELILWHGRPPSPSAALNIPDEEHLSSSDDQSSDPGNKQPQ